MGKRFFLFLMILVMGSGGLSAQTSDDDQAAFNRLVLAVKALDDYRSYKRIIEDQSRTELFVYQNGVLIGEIILNTNTTANETRVTAPSGGNVQTFITFRRTSQSPATGDTAYSIVGELRYVDDILYANTRYQNADAPDLQPIPTGWIVVDESYPPYMDLNLPDFLRDSQRLINVTYDDVDIFLTLIEDVHIENTALDGEAVEMISFTIRGENVRTLFELDPLILELDAEGDILPNIQPESSMSHTVYLDADGRLIKSVLKHAWLVEGMSVPDEPDFSASFTIQMSQTTTFSSINQDFEPILAPEIK